jgi:septation ring formation regulator EzrA
MVNKTNALNRLEQIKNYLSNIKASAYRCDHDQLEDQFETLSDMIEKLEDVITSEAEQFLNRPYGGL